MNNGKVHFSLVPSWEVDKQPMGEEDKQKMDKFVEDMESILQQEL
jgi:hypothetical protein